MAKHARTGAPTAAVDNAALPPGPLPGAGTTGPRHAAANRRSRWLVVVSVGIVLLVAVAVGVVVVTGELPRTTTGGAPVSEPVPSGTSLSAPSNAASVTSATPTSAASSDGSVTAALVEPGILLIATPEPDGSFDVDERVRLEQPLSALPLRPAPVDLAGHEFSSSSGTASGVQLSVDDRSVGVPDDPVERPTTVPVAAGDRFELRYRLTDVTVISAPSTAGRALAAIGPLTGGVGNDLPVHIVVTGPTVLGLNCPLLPFAEQACGSRVSTGPGFEHQLPAGSALVTVQFDLPPG